jgi:hypothetical protein
MAASGLGLSTSFLPGHDTLLRRQRRRPASPAAASFRPVTAELSGVATELGRQLVEAVGVGLPCTVMQCGDVIYRSTLPQNDGLTITAPGVALALAAVSYLWATPGVAPGFFDMFVLAFAERLFRPTFRKVGFALEISNHKSSIATVCADMVLGQDDFVLGKKLGEGAFGVVYKASLANPEAAKKVKANVASACKYSIL